MPTYDYVCEKCKKEFEVFQSMKDEPLKVCICGKKGKVRRKIGGGAGLIFKGSGFYITDYKKKPTPEAKSGGGEKSSSSGGGTEKKPASS
ncbi:MAG: FmdB family zinc ribbon protein [Opitutaceae bacterium]|jgi:putative FmdB family regulatory protein